MFLRTRCDKELFLSLHDKGKMQLAGLPVPVKRPGIGQLSQAGNNFEIERNDQLIRLLSSRVIRNKIKNSYQDLDLENCLNKLNDAPWVVLQGKFSITPYKVQALQNIGLSPIDTAIVPNIADFIPDILVIRESRNGDLLICPDGSRKEINSTLERRFAIDIFDVKHTSEANPSYCSEIAMYALMLANFLHCHPVLNKRFYVTTNAYLWTRFKQGDSEINRLENQGGASTAQILDALITDSEDANLRYYLAAVRRFFEDVVRVIKVGDSAPGNWQNLEWHVNSSCGSCDWLGDKRHLSKPDKDTVTKNPDGYCMPTAQASKHLCLVPGISRGATKVLKTHNIQTTQDLSSAVNHPALQQHTFLKREARNLPTRSNAILSATLSTNPNAVIASLASGANLLLFASINFDPSAGLLTGLALSGVATNFTKGQSPIRFQAVPYLVDQKTLQAEWVALEAFLSDVADRIDRAENLTGNPNLTGQIHFWDERQFKELCNAMGRHLPRVLALTTRKIRALAWVFPPEDLIANPKSLESSTVVTIEDIVRRMVFTPTPHVITLFDTAEHYYSGYNQSEKDPYYREYLSNGIPRERIYEIWLNEPQINRGSTIVLRNTIITEFSNTLKKQVKALESVCEKLRTHYRGQFKSKAPHISTAIPQGARGVAFDGKLWIWWDSLEFNASQLDAHLRLSLEGERLEATYEAILLNNGRLITPPNFSNLYEFDVASGSTEAKFKTDSRLTLGKLGRPGMPLERSTTLLVPNVPEFSGDRDILNFPLWSALSATLVEFDRVNKKARVHFTNQNDPQFISYLITNSSVNLLNNVFLLETKNPSSFDWSDTSKKILQQIGDPSIAVADQNAADAMGITPRARRGGRDPITPASRVLWNAPNLEQQVVISRATATNIANYVTKKHSLNSSQFSAVNHASERALTIIWGPPGTGKTKTLSAFLHGLTQDAVIENLSLKVLVTGPTYKAVEEVMHRTANFLSQDTGAHSSMYMAYSRSRTLGSVPANLHNHVSYTVISIDNSDSNYQQCISDLSDTNSGVVIIGCQIRQARRFPEQVRGNFVQPLFDVVIIDESSQVTVSQSLSALCGLKDNSRLIIAGDHLQMPPITSIDPPSNAEYLVGSIQTYLCERQFQSSLSRCILEENYRSNDHIVKFARSIGYPPSLKAAFPDISLYFLNSIAVRSTYPNTLPWCQNFPDLLKPENKVVTLLHEDEVSSQGNHFEATMVAGIIWMLRQSVSNSLDNYPPSGAVVHALPSPEEFWSKCVGIVTPHRAQRALVIRELEQLFPGEQNFIDEAVDTVERFQGGERHTIIVTFGVADTDVISGEEAFLMQLERTNVAVSRAMAKCIVVMPKSLALHIPADKKALNTAFALKDYVGEFCKTRVDTNFSDATQTRWAQIRFHQ